MTQCIVTAPAAWQLLASKGIDPKTKKLYGPDSIFLDRFEDDLRAGIEAHAPDSAPWVDWYKQITLQHLFDHAAGFARWRYQRRGRAEGASERRVSTGRSRRS